MKVIKYYFFMCLVFFLVGCSNPNVEKEEELKAAVHEEYGTQEDQAVKEEEEEQKEEQQKKEEQKDKNKKIKDIDAVIKFVNETETNQMKDRYGKKLTVLKNYEVHYFDFTGEGNEDIAIVTWEDENKYLPIIFVTTDIVQNEYVLLNSDFRGNEGDIFLSEGNFIIKNDKEDQSYDIAYRTTNDSIKTVTRYISYGNLTEILQPEIGIKYVVNNNLKKLDGFNQFNVHSVFTYYDETEKEHKFEDIIRQYTFNEQKVEFEMVEIYNMESIAVEKLVGDNFVVGTDDSLKTFESIYKENNLEEAINYYYDNRTKFSKTTRIQYIEDYEKLIRNVIPEDYYEMAGRDEKITDGVISSVSIHLNPIPEKIRSVYSVVKMFFVPDASYPTDEIIKNGFYTISCVQSDMTKKITLMHYDKEVLKTGEHSYGSNGDVDVDVEFKTKEQLIKEIKEIVYPTILVDNLNEIDEVKYKDIWKANVVIIPEKVNYY